MRHRGFTLIEVLVSTVLFSLALLLLGSLFVNGSRWYRSIQGKQTRHQEALVSLGLLSKQLRHSCRDSLSMTYLTPDHLALALATPFDDDGTYHSDATSGLPQYQGIMIYFCRDSSDTLEVCRQNVAPSATPPPPLTATALTTACGPPGHIISRGVQAFRVIDLSTGTLRTTVSNPIRIEVQMGGETVDRVLRTYY